MTENQGLKELIKLAYTYEINIRVHRKKMDSPFEGEVATFIPLIKVFINHENMSKKLLLLILAHELGHLFTPKAPYHRNRRQVLKSRRQVLRDECSAWAWARKFLAIRGLWTRTMTNLRHLCLKSYKVGEVRQSLSKRMFSEARSMQ